MPLVLRNILNKNQYRPFGNNKLHIQRDHRLETAPQEIQNQGITENGRLGRIDGKGKRNDIVRRNGQSVGHINPERIGRVVRDLQSNGIDTAIGQSQ